MYHFLKNRLIVPIIKIKDRTRLSYSTIMAPESNDESENKSKSSSKLVACIKVGVSAALLLSSIATYQSSLSRQHQPMVSNIDVRRRLSSLTGIPSYIEGLMKDLEERKKLFDETPPDEVKYWFEYTGPLQVSHLTIIIITHDQGQGIAMMYTTPMIADLQSLP